MKRFLVAGLSTITLSLVAAPVLANEISVAKENMSPNIVEVTPHNLISHGYQGYFVNQGIPSNGAFLAAVKSGRVDEVKLVESAIAKGRLSPETLEDKSYINSVRSLLQNLDNE